MEDREKETTTKVPRAAALVKALVSGGGRRAPNFVLNIEGFTGLGNIATAKHVTGHFTPAKLKGGEGKTYGVLQPGVGGEIWVTGSCDAYPTMMFHMVGLTKMERLGLETPPTVPLGMRLDRVEATLAVPWPTAATPSLAASRASRLLWTHRLSVK